MVVNHGKKEKKNFRKVRAVSFAQKMLGYTQ